MPTDTILDQFSAAYIECALWSSLDDETPMDSLYSIDDIAAAALASMMADCAAFCDANAADIGDEHERAGHDFWLTRNGHGCGFWDGDWSEEVGDRLTKASEAYGECDLYVGDDGFIYCV